MKIRSFLQASLLSLTGETLHEKTARLKRSLFSDLSGTVIEIGAGSGVNIAVLPAKVSRYIGVEPNPFLREALGGITTSPPLAIEAVNAVAEHLPFGDDFADAVISTFVLCSVQDQRATLQEVLRVLKPGGKFIFIEHIAAPHRTLARLLQRVCSPFSRHLCGGCQWHRDTGAIIHDAKFSVTNIAVGFPLRRFSFAPTIAGSCIK